MDPGYETRVTGRPSLTWGRASVLFSSSWSRSPWWPRSQTQQVYSTSRGIPAPARIQHDQPACPAPALCAGTGPLRIRLTGRVAGIGSHPGRPDCDPSPRSSGALHARGSACSPGQNPVDRACIPVRGSRPCLRDRDHAAQRRVGRGPPASRHLPGAQPATPARGLLAAWSAVATGHQACCGSAPLGPAPPTRWTTCPRRAGITISAWRFARQGAVCAITATAAATLALTLA